MKNNVLVLAVFALLVFLLPLAALFVPAVSGVPAASGTGTADSLTGTDGTGAGGAGAADGLTGTGSAGTGAGGVSEALPAASGSAAQQAADGTEPPLLIYDEGVKKVLTVPVRTFVLGAVAAEMPVTWPDEALKAQAVAAHSYALALAANGGDAALDGAYFSANPAQRRGYLDSAGMQALWGTSCAANRAKLEALVDSVLGEVLTYDGAPATACYHAISSGTTESSEAVWGKALPYLVSVASPYDLSAPDYAAELNFSAQEFTDGLYLNGTGVRTAGDPSAWVEAIDTDSAGYVRTITICGQTITGPAFRKALGLRSAAFTVAYDRQSGFTITTHGYGHGVGMSQYGASRMAAAGSTYREILALYYPGTQLSAAGAGT